MRRSLALTSVTILSLALTSCGSGDEAESEPEAQETEAGGDAAVDVDAVLEEFAGETVTILLPYPGGSYDDILRALIPHLEEYLGTTVQVEVQEGAGGLLAMNHMSTLEPDGFTVGIFSGPGMVAAQLREAEGIQFDLAEMSYVGRVTNDDRFVFVGTHTGLETMEDVIETDGFKWASSGPGSTDYLDPAVIIEVFDLNHEIVTGYSSGPETILSILAGETDGQGGTSGERLSHVETGEMQVMMAITSEPADPYPDAPVFVTDFGLEGEALEVAETHAGMQAVGRPLIGPPGIPEGRLQVLRDALAYAVEQEDFLSTMEQNNRTVSHLPGDELEELVHGLLDAPEAYVELLSEE